MNLKTEPTVLKPDAPWFDFINHIIFYHENAPFKEMAGIHPTVPDSMHWPLATKQDLLEYKNSTKNPPDSVILENIGTAKSPDGNWTSPGIESSDLSLNAYVRCEDNHADKEWQFLVVLYIPAPEGSSVVGAGGESHIPEYVSGIDIKRSGVDESGVYTQSRKMHILAGTEATIICRYGDAP